MSEQYLQSQYLIKQITQDFFKEDSTPIRMKESNYNFDDDLSIESESTLEENLDEDFDDTYHYLHDKEDLQYIFDLCDNEIDVLKEYQIHICCYKINNLCVLPFIQYFLIDNDDKYSYPSFSFKCATNIQVEEDNEFSPKHVFFQNECTKFLLKFAKPLEENEDTDLMKDIYKGFTTGKNDNIYVILDCNNFDFESGVFATMDEMLNKHSVLNIPIEPTSYELFYRNRELMQIKDKWGTMIQIPHILYRCSFENNQYVNIEGKSEETISIIDDRIEHPLLGNSFIFSVKPINLDNLSSLKRFVVFTLKPVYLMKDLGMIEKEEEGLTLGKVIPTIVDYMQSEKKENEEEVENPEEEEESDDGTDDEGDDDDEEEEPEEEPEEESEDIKTNDELREEIYELSNKTNESIYFHEKRNNVDFTGWSVKLSTHFIEL